MFHQFPSRPSGSRVVRGFAGATALVLVLVLAAPIVRAQSQAALNPPHSDAGVDTDADSLFNTLRVNVNVMVTTAGLFTAFVDLYDNSGVVLITGNAAFANLGLGPGIVPVDLPGMDIYTSGFDGPYQVSILLYDDTFNLDDFGGYTTGLYLFTDFDPPGALFAPPHTDAGIDTDGDLLYNALRINATVDVSQAGTYNIDGYAYDSSFNFISAAFASRALPAGPGQLIPLDFPGWTFRANGVDGPYTIDLTLIDLLGGVLDNNQHTTSFYPAMGFDMAPVSLTPPHTDAGVDTDGDALFNAIEIGARLQVNDTGDYTVSVDFWDQTFTAYIGFNSSSVTLATGAQTTPVWMSTLPMVLMGLGGPYGVEISVRDTALNLISQDAFVTSNYALGQFDQIPATFAPPHSDVGEDRDVPPDGQSNVLRVNVSLSVADPGSFILFANLMDPAMTILIGNEFRFLSIPTSGPATVPLYFSGVQIRQSGIDGPYAVVMTLLSFPDFLTLDTNIYTTSSYLANDFQNTVPENLSGTVRDSATSAGVPFANVAAFDARNSVMMRTFTDGTGAYSLGLYQGTWSVLFDDPGYDAALDPVSIAGPTTLNHDMMPITPDMRIGNGTLGPWNTLNLAFTAFMEEDVVLLRTQLDWILGDRDGTLSQAEWDAFLQFGGIPPPTPLNSTWNVLFVNDRWYDFVPGSDWSGFFDAPAPIGSTVPIRLEAHSAFTNSTILPAPSRTIRVNVTYDTVAEDFRYNVLLPPGYVLSSFTGMPGVTITGVNTNTATIEPGPDPNPADFIDAVEVRLVVTTTDATNPTVSSATATPNPVISGNLVNFNAIVTDTTGVADVRLEVWNPMGGLSVNVLMSDTGGGRYTYGATYPNIVGDWTFTVTATDYAGNTASRSGSFTVIELNPPTISRTSATPSPQEAGQSVLIAATVSDDTTVATVTAEVRNATGVLFGNFTMVFNSTSLDYEFSDAFVAVGMNAYTVWATDTSGNVASAAGTFTIVDTTDPVLAGVTALPNPVEVRSPVRISVRATDATSLRLRVTVRDPNAVVVGTFDMVAAGGGVYRYDFTPADVGSHTFTITATDAGANTVTMPPGTFLSQDTTDPIANAGPPQTVTVGALVTFDGSASSDNDGVDTYTWTFTEGGRTQTLTGPAPTHTFATAGVYVVTLRVEDASSNFNETTVTIIVQAAGGVLGSVGWIAAIVLIAIVVLVAAIWFMKRRKSPPVEAQGAPPPMVSPPPPPDRPPPPPE